ncbi:hypothetical protein ABE196_19100 [Bacillus subtilis]
MGFSANEFKKNKDMTEMLLKINGKTYKEWLHEQHIKFVEENHNLVLTALSALATDDTN